MGDKQNESGRRNKQREKIYILANDTMLSVPIQYRLYLYYPSMNWDVKGLWFGAKGTASKLILDFFKSNMLKKEDLRIICLEIMKDRFNIIH